MISDYCFCTLALGERYRHMAINFNDMSAPQEGYLYIVHGERYLKEAITSAASLKKVIAEFRQEIKRPRCALFEQAIIYRDGEAEFHLSRAARAKRGLSDAPPLLRNPAGHMEIHPCIEFHETTGMGQTPIWGTG